MIAYDVVAENDEVGRSAVDDAKRKEQVQMARKHVFVVDSAGAFLSLARDLLQDEAYNVTTTNYVPRTFDQIAALGPDLLVVDLAVGQRAGWDLLEQLQAGALTHDIPVVVTSTDPRMLARAERYRERFGGRRWFAKPYDLDGLLAAVRELTGPA
ncbi:MAG: hypothetical protein QOF73_2852 [Thermomicrobiales bacterium]|nr:hypothetical protein [Thermomicrobiales bacterium]